jgi:hypothetical protein
MLFVGESPPASGRFFYHRDSGLYRALRDAFRVVDRSITDENFLEAFQQAGCYLVDTSRQPVDRLGPASRRKACLAGESLLSRRIRTLQPETIVTLVLSIREIVERAAHRASWSGTLLAVPYPGRWIHHRKMFLEVILPHLRKLLDSSPATSRD